MYKITQDFILLAVKCDYRARSAIRAVVKVRRIIKKSRKIARQIELMSKGRV